MARGSCYFSIQDKGILCIAKSSRAARRALEHEQGAAGQGGAGRELRAGAGASPRVHRQLELRQALLGVLSRVYRRLG